MSKRIALALVAVASVTGCSEDNRLEVYKDPAGASASELAVDEANESSVMFDWQGGAALITVERCPCQPVCPSDDELPNLVYDYVWERMVADPDPVYADTDLDLVRLPHPLPYGASLNSWDEPAKALEPGTSYRVAISMLPEDRDFTADELIASDLEMTNELVQFSVSESGALQIEEIDEDTSCL